MEVAPALIGRHQIRNRPYLAKRGSINDKGRGMGGQARRQGRRSGVDLRSSGGLTACRGTSRLEDFSRLSAEQNGRVHTRVAAPDNHHLRSQRAAGRIVSAGDITAAVCSAARSGLGAATSATKRTKSSRQRRHDALPAASPRPLTPLFRRGAQSDAAGGDGRVTAAAPRHSALSIPAPLPAEGTARTFGCCWVARALYLSGCLATTCPGVRSATE